MFRNMTRLALAASIVLALYSWRVCESVAENYPLALDDIAVRDPFILCSPLCSPSFGSPQTRHML